MEMLGGDVKLHNAQGVRNSRSKLNDDKVRKIKTLLVHGVNSKAIAKRFRVARSTIDRIKTGYAWRHVQ